MFPNKVLQTRQAKFQKSVDKEEIYANKHRTQKKVIFSLQFVQFMIIKCHLLIDVDILF